MPANIRRFKVGAFECIAIKDGFHRYQLHELFANVPTSEVEVALRGCGLPIDYVETPYTCLLINSGRQRILVDVGAGNIIPNTGLLCRNLRLAGIVPEEIDAVIITHGHPDHIGGNLDCRGKSIYSKARYFMMRAEWDFWMSSEAAAHTSPMFVSLAHQQLAPIEDRLHCLDHGEEIAPGIVAILARGHTPGHMALSICSDDQLLIHVSDTVLHPLHLYYPDWLPIFDILPRDAAASKRFIFDWAAAVHSLVFAHHFPPFPNLGYLARRDIGWHWEPIHEH